MFHANDMSQDIFPWLEKKDKFNYSINLTNHKIQIDWVFFPVVCCAYFELETQLDIQNYRSTHGRKKTQINVEQG